MALDINTEIDTMDSAMLMKGYEMMMEVITIIMKGRQLLSCLLTRRND